MCKFLVVLVVLVGFVGACAPAQAMETAVPNVESVSPTATTGSTLAPTATLEPTLFTTITLEPTAVPTMAPTATPAARVRVVLTIDDGLSKEVFDAMLDILAENDSHATFFLVATASRRLGSERLARLVEEGHEIAYHSYNHDALGVLQSWGTREWSETIGSG